MKIVHISILVSIVSLFSSCDTRIELNKENLIGKWSATYVNGNAVALSGFKSITLEITSNDSLELTSVIQGQSDFNIVSRGSWKIEDKFFCKIGEGWTQSKVELYEKKLLFNPDPFFNPEEIKFTEFKRIE